MAIHASSPARSVSSILVAARDRSSRPPSHRSVVLVIVAIAITLLGCGPGGVEGSGPAKAETRSVDPFAEVVVGDGISLTLQVGGEQSLEVSAQENILSLVSTTVVDGVLTVRASGSFTTSTGVTVTATVASVVGITASGGSQTSVQGLAADQLEVNLSGGAGLVATGTVAHVTLVASGGSTADLETLTTETMRIDISGGATAALSVSDNVSGTAASGAVGSVVGGASVDVDTSGGARFSND